MKMRTKTIHRQSDESQHTTDIMVDVAAAAATRFELDNDESREWSVLDEFVCVCVCLTTIEKRRERATCGGKTHR